MTSKNQMVAVAGLLQAQEDQPPAAEGGSDGGAAPASEPVVDVFEEAFRHQTYVELSGTISEVALRLSGRAPDTWWAAAARACTRVRACRRGGGVCVGRPGLGWPCTACAAPVAAAGRGGLKRSLRLVLALALRRSALLPLPQVAAGRRRRRQPRAPRGRHLTRWRRRAGSGGGRARWHDAGVGRCRRGAGCSRS
jgi:hypothetical protein